MGHVSGEGRRGVWEGRRVNLLESIVEFESIFNVISNDIGHEFPPGERNADAEKCSDKLNWSRAPNGDRYVTVTSGGVKPEGEPMDAAFHSEDDAIAAWLFQATLWTNGRTGTLYWRQRPEVNKTSKPRERYSIWSRFMVADHKAAVT